MNERGAERAIQTGAVQTLGFPYSISPQFLRRNQNQAPEEALQVLQIDREARARSGIECGGLCLDGLWESVWGCVEHRPGCGRVRTSDRMRDSDKSPWPIRWVWQQSAQISETVTRALAAQNEAEIGVHLHSRPQDAAAKIRAAYQAGCRRFDAAIGGLGGCPFAQDALVGNISTEILLAELRALGAQTPELGPLNELTHANAAIAESYGPAAG